jgi:hypothetical protein
LLNQQILKQARTTVSPAFGLQFIPFFYHLAKLRRSQRTNETEKKFIPQSKTKLKKNILMANAEFREKRETERER